MENPIPRYLEDAIAAEKSFETQLRGFAEEATLEGARTAFRTHADETRQQYEMLTLRLKALGSTQHLMITYAAASAEMAMYECLTTSAEAAGDRETASLARTLQAEEKEDHTLAWEHLAGTARNATVKVLRA